MMNKSAQGFYKHRVATAAVNNNNHFQTQQNMMIKEMGTLYLRTGTSQLKERNPPIGGDKN